MQNEETSGGLCRKNTPSFENTEIAFKSKTNGELEHAYWLFKLISNAVLVRIGGPLTNFALKIGLPIQGIIKKTIFRHFCGGQTIEDCNNTIQTLNSYNIYTILDYSVEGRETEAAFDKTCDEILKTIRRAENDQAIPFSVFKPTGLGRFQLFEKINTQEKISPKEQEEFERIKVRIDRICQACFNIDLHVLIDAEHSWIQDTIDNIAREMMQKYNRKKVIVFNTYQLYRRDKLASLKADFHLAKTDGFYLGAKLVRGAYMEIERERAKEKDYLSPIHPNKKATDRDYNKAVLFCLDHFDQIAFMAGTHNEKNCSILVEEMGKRNIAPDYSGIYFAQLFGMSDNLSFNLASAQYNVAKYIPYGPVKAVIPYLMRRARENTSVIGQTNRELQLITKEIKRRKQKT